MDSLNKSMVSITTKVGNLQTQFMQNKKDTNLCLSQLEWMQRKCNDLEDHSRRNNVHLVNLPTGMEGDDSVAFYRECYLKGSPIFWCAEAQSRSIELIKYTLTSTHLNHDHWYSGSSVILTGKPSFKKPGKQNPLCLEEHAWNSILITVMRRCQRENIFGRKTQASPERCQNFPDPTQHHWE